MTEQVKLENSAQKYLFHYLRNNKGLDYAIESLPEIAKFNSFTQVRALKAGASLQEAILFNDSLKLRSLEAGSSIKKALKVKNLEQVMHYEKKTSLAEKISENKGNDYKIDSKFHLVLDIDDVFCREIADSNSNYIVDHQWIQNSFPDSYITNWKYKNIEKTYLCFPNFDKLITIVTSWDNWSVNFFSAEESSRNIKVVTDYLTHKLGYENFSHLIDSGKLSVFSKDHLTYEETSIANFSKLVKNLKVISHDIDNIILADDNPQNASKDQTQVIGLSIESSKKMINMVKTLENKTEDLKFNPLNNAAYILGIVASAKKMIENGEAYCLREAVDLTLRYEGAPNQCNSQWYTDPDCALIHDESFLEKQIDWINSGLNYFEQI